MPRILVTGATGFIGRGLCAEFLHKYGSVRGTVRQDDPSGVLPTGVDSIPIQAIDEKTDWTRALVEIDTVIHLAARAHVMREVDEHPLAAYRRVNVSGTERLARMAAAGGVKRLVFVSSVKVHGEESSARYMETHRPAPLDPYGISKFEAEEVLRTISEETGLEVVIIRPPLVYGPGVKANFYRLMVAVARGYPLPFAAVNNSRSLIYLGNLIDAIALCADHPRASGQTFLVSDGDDISTPELVRRLAEALGCSAHLFALPPGVMQLAGRLTGKSAAVGRLLGSLMVDSGRIRRELDWRPPFTLAEGIRDTANWFKG